MLDEVMRLFGVVYHLSIYLCKCCKLIIMRLMRQRKLHRKFEIPKKLKCDRFKSIKSEFTNVE